MGNAFVNLLMQLLGMQPGQPHDPPALYAQEHNGRNKTYTTCFVRRDTGDYSNRHDARRPCDAALFRSVVEEGRYTVQEQSEVTITEDEEREYIEADRKDPGHLCLVATVGGVVVGMLRAQAESYRRTRHFADIDAMWVHASWRRRGLARHLLAELIAWAQGHLEIEKLGLYVFSTNTAAVRLYQEHGFVVEGRYPRDMKFGDGSYVDTVAMGLLVKARPAEGQA